MTTSTSAALEHRTTPWLFGVALATTAPHGLHQPLWLSAFAFLIFAWAYWLWSNDRRLPGRWTMSLLVVAASGAILIDFHTLFGREAGVSLLVCMMSLKLLELRSRRDAQTVIMLAYFLLLTHYFESQEILTGLWLLLCIWWITASLVLLHGGRECQPRQAIRHGGLLCLQAVPFLLVLYLLFPRISGPLWGLPQDAHGGKTGLSETMAPGKISSLAQNPEIAFRVRFDNELPAMRKLYWRGPVLENFDGQTWQPAFDDFRQYSLQPLSSPIGYEITLEAHQQRWLLALDAPMTLPAQATINNRLSVLSKAPVTSRERFHFSAALDYRFNVDESPLILKRNLKLPRNSNPQAVALGEQWRTRHISSEIIINEALAMFNKEFRYTLMPPLLGRNSVDEFLFKSKSGFCEHYAAAFVLLMRAAGIPARVVMGYQGGELNPLDNFLVVRQSDAHAWSEVWLEGKGWLRIDPTAAVSPSRVELGVAAAFAGSNELPALLGNRMSLLVQLRYRWEALNNAWNQQILGYDAGRQRAFFAQLGWSNIDWQGLTALMASISASLLVLIFAWAVYHRPQQDPATRLWKKALRRIERIQVNCAPWETPSCIARRVREKDPNLAPHFDEVVDAYLAARYGPPPEDISRLRKAVEQLP